MISGRGETRTVSSPVGASWSLCALPRSRLGFSIVELLVVIGIISALIALMFPALRLAREQARIVKCLTNLRQIGIAHQGYYDETNRVPAGVRDTMRSETIAPWSFGGIGNRERWPWILRWSAGQRPMNYYLYPGAVSPTEERNIPDEERPDLAVYRCPSDSFSYAFLPWGEPYDVSAYEDIGSSYTQNMLYTSCQCSFVTNSDLQTSLDIGLSRLAMRYGDRFIYYLEEPANEAISRQRRYKGHHGEVGGHTVLYLDGHAAYIHIDTTEPLGDGWTMLDPELPNPFDD
ncbi:MAG: DUF1559 domain-containing protein [Phycisphaerae bacterium]|jgi:type II secretory pathway pseudopilin PulG